MSVDDGAAGYCHLMSGLLLDTDSNGLSALRADGKVMDDVRFDVGRLGGGHAGHDPSGLANSVEEIVEKLFEVLLVDDEILR